MLPVFSNAVKLSIVSPRLTRAGIVEAAFALLDDVGVDGLTMRALAARLGVKAPALYWHVPSKQDLLDEMGTEVARRIAAGAGAAREDFGTALRGYAVAMRTEYLAHRDGARLFSGTRITDPEVLRANESRFRYWVDRGIPVEAIVDAFDIVTSFVVGFVIEEQERDDDTRYSLAQRDERVGEGYPLVQAAGHHSFRPAQRRFDEQLAVVVGALANSVARVTIGNRAGRSGRMGP